MSIFGVSIFGRRRYLDFDRNDDIFEVVYDTEVIIHANWIYHIMFLNRTKIIYLAPSLHWIWVDLLISRRKEGARYVIFVLFWNVILDFFMGIVLCYSLIHSSCDPFWFSRSIECIRLSEKRNRGLRRKGSHI